MDCGELTGRVRVQRGHTVFVELFEWLPAVVGGALLALGGVGPWFYVGVASLASGLVIGSIAGRESSRSLVRSVCRGLSRAVGRVQVAKGLVSFDRRGVYAALRLEGGVDVHFWGGLLGMWAVAARSPVYVRGRGGGPGLHTLPCRPRSWRGRLEYGVVHPVFGWRARVYGRGGVASVFCPLGVLDESLVARVVGGALRAAY